MSIVKWFKNNYKFNTVRIYTDIVLSIEYLSYEWFFYYIPYSNIPNT